MEKFYFTFGSSDGFPEECRNGFVLVRAKSWKDAIRIFRQHYPDRYENTVNCAFFYSQEEWDRSIAKWYDGKEPARVFEQEGTCLWTA
jgi:hypothetical protein